MPSTIKLDLSGLNKLKKRLNSAEDTRLQVGHLELSMHPTADMTMAEVAKINHDGATLDDGQEIPSRPYIIHGMMNPALIKKLQDSTEKIVEGQSTAFKELRKLGPQFKQSIKKDMGNPAIFESNAPMTLEKKGGRNTPLVDEGHLRRDVKQKLVRKANGK